MLRGGKVLCKKSYYQYCKPQCKVLLKKTSYRGRLVGGRQLGVGDVGGGKWTMMQELVLQHCLPETQS